MLLGIRLLRTTFWCGLSNHQAATAQMGSSQAEFSPRINKYCRVPTPLRSTSPFSDRWSRPGAGRGRGQGLRLRAPPRLLCGVPGEDHVDQVAEAAHARHVRQVRGVEHLLGRTRELSVMCICCIICAYSRNAHMYAMNTSVA